MRYLVVTAAALVVKNGVDNAGFFGRWAHLVADAILYPFNWAIKKIVGMFRGLTSGITDALASAWNSVTRWVVGWWPF